MKKHIKKFKSKKVRKNMAVLAFALLLIIKIANAIPVPHGIDGIVYELDGLTEVRSGIDFYVHNLNSGHAIYGKTGYGSSGRYSAAINGNDGDKITVKVWNKYNQANATLTLTGVMHNANIFLNMTFPNIAPIISSVPPISAVEDTPYVYQITAFDENDDPLEYFLIKSPIGMSIDKSTGLVIWTPADKDIGSHDIVVQSSDGLLAVNQSFTINVQNVNDRPNIISMPITEGTQGRMYFYDVDAIDEDNEILSYSLIKNPEGMEIGKATGLINWTPDNSQIGPNQIIVGASDGNLTDTQEFVINVSNVNDLPVITSLPVTIGIEDEVYTYDVEAYDIDNDILDYSLIDPPEGMEIDKNKGIIKWVPQNNNTGMHNITVKVSDYAGFSLQPFTLLIKNVNDAPIINSTPAEESKVGKEYTYDADAYDIDNDELAYYLIAAPQGMSIDKSTGVVEWKPKGSQKGNNAVILEASDGNLTARQEFNVFVFDSKNQEGRNNEISVSGGVSSSSSGGGGGARGEITGINQKNKTSIISIKTALNGIFKVEELSERPKNVDRISKRVYKYLKISHDGEEDINEAVINFTVDLSWLGQNGIKKEDVAMARYTAEGWQELATQNIGKDDLRAYYVSKTPGFSYFAIAVKDGAAAESIIRPQISKVNAAYRISGTVYSFGKMEQAAKGTRIAFENLNTSETSIVETGEGPYSGFYYTLLHGREGDLIKIKVGGRNKEVFTLLKDTDGLDFTTAPGKISLFSAVFVISIIFLIYLSALARIKYKKKRWH